MRAVNAIIITLGLVFCFGRDCRAQTLEASYEFGRIYNLPEGRYVRAAIPGLSFTFGAYTLSWLHYLELDGTWFEQDAIIAWDRKIRGRVRFSASAGYYRWRGGIQDWSVTSGIRVRIR